MTKPVPLRDDGYCNPSGLKMIEEMAANNKTQGTIAAALGISKKRFEKMLERAKGDNAERLAWERGHSRLEQLISDALLASALGSEMEQPVKDENNEIVIDEATGLAKTEKVRIISKGGSIHLMFYAKTRLGWQEKPTGPMVQDNRINITLPASVSMEEFMRMTGQDGILDFRKDKTTVPLEEATKSLMLPSPNMATTTEED